MKFVKPVDNEPMYVKKNVEAPGSLLANVEMVEAGL
jgi:hypothetical protein